MTNVLYLNFVNVPKKVADLIELMNDVFPKYPRENIIIACMACIQGAYKTGQNDVLNARQMQKLNKEKP